MKTLFILVLFSSWSLSNLNAQSDDTLKHKRGHKMEHKRSAMKSLDLTEEQKIKMKAIHEKRKEAVKQRKEENKQFHQNLNKQSQAEISQVLNPVQKLKYDSIRAQRKDDFIQKRNVGRYRNHVKDSI